MMLKLSSTELGVADI